MNHTCFNSKLQSIATLWLVLTSRLTEGKRLRWPWWLGEILRWFASPKNSHQSMSAERDWSGKRSAAGRKLSERERSGERAYKKTMERERSEEQEGHGAGMERSAD